MGKKKKSTKKGVGFFEKKPLKREIMKHKRRSDKTTLKKEMRNHKRKNRQQPVCPCSIL